MRIFYHISLLFSCQVNNADDVNREPDQKPVRFIINFYDFDIEKAKQFKAPFEIVEKRVKPYRETVSDQAGRTKWWIYKRNKIELYESLKKKDSCFVTAFTSKYMAFSKVSTGYVISNALNIIDSTSLSLFSILQSNIHEEWVRKYSSSLETRLRYSSTDVFETFPLPQLGSPETHNILSRIGNSYYEHRRISMLSLQIGLTKTYNLFHKKDLAVADIEKESKQPTALCERGYRDILKLRELHVEMDNAVLSAYDWTDINLGHDFYEVDYLPENDRIRFTISPDARREVLKRLLKLNHEIHDQEVKAGLWDKKKTVKTKVVKSEEPLTPLLPEIDIGVLAAVSYPATERDKAICATALAIIEQTDGLPSIDHLDALLLATHPEWCKMFLDPTDHAGFKKILASTPKELFVGGGDSIRWKDCRDYLEQQRNAISVNRSQKGQPITAGSDLLKVKTAFSRDTDKIVEYALKALERVKTVRDDVLLSQELKNILHNMKQQHE